MRRCHRFALAGALAGALASAHPQLAIADAAPGAAPASASAAGAAPPAAPSASAAAPQSPPSASPPPTTSPASAPSAAATTAVAPAAAQGAIVVAIGEGSGPAARALAREAYADEALRPRIDDVTARVLAGEAPPASAPAKLAEITEVRRALSTSETSSTDAVARRLLASLGADLGASIVVTVSMRDAAPVARALLVSTAAFAPVEWTATLEPQTDGSTRVKWSNVVPLLAALTKSPRPAGSAPAPSPRAPAPNTGPVKNPSPGPAAPTKEEPRSFWTSPWTWAGIGVVAAAGVVVFAVSQAQGDGGGLRLQGRVSP